MWDLTYANFAVQFFILVGLVLYVRETQRLREASQEQVKASQEQLEAMHMPCLIIPATARRAEDAILGMDDIIGAMEVQQRADRVVLQNIGTGPAFNIRYNFRRVGQSGNVGYLSYIPSGEVFAIPLAVGTLRASEWEAVISYQSLTSREYKTEMTINNLVFTKFLFS